MFVIAKKEFKSLINEKTLLLAILIQLFIASFSSFLVIGLTSFYSPEAIGPDIANVNIGIYGDRETGLVKLLENDRRVSITHFSSFKDAKEKFYDHRIDGIVVVPSMPENSSDAIKIDIFLPRNDIRSTLIAVYLKEPLEEFEMELRYDDIDKLPPVAKLDVEGSDSSTSYFEFIYGLLIPLLMFTPAFISGGLIIDLITEEFDHETIDLLMVSPITSTQVMHGKLLVAAVIAPLQAFAWIALLVLNGISVYNVSMILILVTAVTCLLVLFGAILSLQFKERGQVHFIYSILLLLLFTTSSLMPNSPFNLTAKLAIGSAGASGLLMLGVYMMVLVPLYLIIRRMIHGMEW
ncbi:MAG: ABC transporter permease [Halobacteriota archaeon]|nr:ABC transporter permease [Halobacteriota archaeon]